MKKLWKNLLGAAAGAAAVLLGYSIYVFAAYDRLEDRLPLTVENARAAGTVDPELDPALFAFFLDNLFMMLKFSYSCDYYAERMKIFCGADIADDTEKVTEYFIRFAKNALKIGR